MSYICLACCIETERDQTKNFVLHTESPLYIENTQMINYKE